MESRAVCSLLAVRGEFILSGTVVNGGEFSDR